MTVKERNRGRSYKIPRYHSVSFLFLVCRWCHRTSLLYIKKTLTYQEVLVEIYCEIILLSMIINNLSSVCNALYIWLNVKGVYITFFCAVAIARAKQESICMTLHFIVICEANLSRFLFLIENGIIRNKSNSCRKVCAHGSL